MEETENLEEKDNIIPPADGADIRDETDSEETDFSPPDGPNEARQLNMGNIFGVMMISIAVILGVVLVFTKPKKDKKQVSDDLNKAGSKYIPDIKIKEKNSTENSLVLNKDDKEDDIDDILSTLPPSFSQPEPAAAPIITSAPSSSPSQKSSRPDTRNSKSPRKIDGIAGQSYAGSATNQDIVTAIMGGQNYSSAPYSSSAAMTREEYIEKTMEQARAISYSNGNFQDSNISAAQRIQSNKEAFFDGNIAGGKSGTGQYLSYSALWDGTIISAALETAINTDNPGLVIARVTENVYSSYDGSFLLIPEGSLLYATYNSSVSYGQNRVQIAWNLLIRPDGYRVELGNMNGVDAQGASGIKGLVNNHPFQTLKALGLVAVYSIIQTEINSQIQSNENPYIQNAISDTYSQASKIGNKIIDKALDIKPTIQIKAGREIKLITNTPLNLPPVKVEQVTRKYVRTR